MTFMDYAGVAPKTVETADGGGSNGKEVAFVTPQTLLSFPVASGVVAAIWGVLKAVDSGLGGKGIALLISFVMGAFLFAINEAAGAKEYGLVVRVGVAVINSFMLAATALGINAAT